MAQGAAYWFLRRTLGADQRALPLTHADSIGLPLFAFGIMSGGLLVLGNLAAALLALRRKS